MAKHYFYRVRTMYPYVQDHQLHVQSPRRHSSVAAMMSAEAVGVIVALAAVDTVGRAEDGDDGDDDDDGDEDSRYRDGD